MTYIDNSQKMEDPYYWRNKVMFWRAVNEAYSRDSENSSDLTWAKVVGKGLASSCTPHKSNTREEEEVFLQKIVRLLASPITFPITEGS
jgi:hypothetical protein